MSVRIAVVYFSWSWGNTEGIAKRIQDRMGADLYAISPCDPYPRVEDIVVARAKEEVFGKQTPGIERLDIDFDAYDVILLGCPVWWLSIAPPMRTFVISNIDRLRSKRMACFVTRAKWPGTAMHDLHALLRGCDLLPDLDCEFGTDKAYEMVTPLETVDAWISEVRATSAEGRLLQSCCQER